MVLTHRDRQPSRRSGERGNDSKTNLSCLLQDGRGEDTRAQVQAMLPAHTGTLTAAPEGNEQMLSQQQITVRILCQPGVANVAETHVGFPDDSYLQVHHHGQQIPLPQGQVDHQQTPYDPVWAASGGQGVSGVTRQLRAMVSPTKEEATDKQVSRVHVMVSALKATCNVKC